MSTRKDIATLDTVRRYWRTETMRSTFAAHSPRNEKEAAAFGATCGTTFAIAKGQNSGLLCVDPGRTALHT